ncbi:hypothetical protein [Stutzerimonas tarimensis]|uniref:Uncharacterized protein n=1 Tax=Stutzerimonas tarimensis TaxID=1507735 RepID=A0ABV7TA67_9GAMM
MKRQIRTSLASQGFFTAAVVGLLLVAGDPVAQPLEQMSGERVERNRLHDAQPMQINQLSVDDYRLEETRVNEASQRWVF